MADGVKVEAERFRAVLADAKAADRKLYAGLRKEIRSIGAEMADAVKKTVLEPPPPNKSGRTRDVGVRRAIAAGTSAKLSNTEKSAGVTVRTSGRYIPENRRRMVRLYNRKNGWRHPVFPRYKGKLSKSGVESLDHLIAARNKARHESNRRNAVWVEQKGRPYFGAAITPHADSFGDRMSKLLDTYVENIRRN